MEDDIHEAEGLDVSGHALGALVTAFAPRPAFGFVALERFVCAQCDPGSAPVAFAPCAIWC